MSDQAYQGFAKLAAGTSEFNKIAFQISQALSGVNTAALVQVKEVVNAGEVDAVGFIAVQPMVSAMDGKGQAVPHGIIYNVPYFRIQGGANAIILDPQVGDIGLCIFASRDISSVKVNKAVALPGSRRKFDWADGLYVGGFLNGVPEQFVRFAAAGIEVVSPTKITLQAPTIELDGAVTGSSTGVFQGDVTAAGKSVSTHTHTSASPGNPTSPPN